MNFISNFLIFYPCIMLRATSEQNFRDDKKFKKNMTNVLLGRFLWLLFSNENRSNFNLPNSFFEHPFCVTKPFTQL